MNKFYLFKNKTDNAVDLFINGEIMDDQSKTLAKAWFDDDSGVCPSEFHVELNEHAGKMINLYIDSYGGDVFAASSIYTALKEHKGGVTVKISGIAASAASVIAMAGDKVLMSKTATIMIHNPLTTAFGDHNEMEKAAETLNVIKESIINAYENKTGLDRKTIDDLMEKETWMDYNKAIELGFCDGMIEDETIGETVHNCIENRMFVYNSLYGNVAIGDGDKPPKKTPTPIIKNDSLDKAEIEADEQMYAYQVARNKR